MKKTRLLLVSATVALAMAATALADDATQILAYNAGYAPPAHGEKIAAMDAKTSAFLRRITEEYLAGQMPEAVEEWRIAELSVTTNDKIPADFDSYRIAPLRSSRGGEYRTLAVEFSKNGNVIKRLGIDLKVEMFAEMVVAKNRINRGTTITADMLELERHTVDSPLEDLCTQIAQASGQVAERSVLPGRAVLQSGLARAADIKAGDVVTIIAETDSIRLSSRGIAKKDGTIGEMIPVVNLRSNKKLFAKVVDSGTVQVLF